MSNNSRRRGKPKMEFSAGLERAKKLNLTILDNGKWNGISSEVDFECDKCNHSWNENASVVINTRGKTGRCCPKCHPKGSGKGRKARFIPLTDIDAFLAKFKQNISIEAWDDNHVTITQINVALKNTTSDHFEEKNNPYPDEHHDEYQNDSGVETLEEDDYNTDEDDSVGEY